MDTSSIIRLLKNLIHSEQSKSLEKVISLSYFAVLGSLLRFCFSLLGNEYELKYQLFSILPNILGCFIIGFACKFKKHAEVLQLLFVYIGLTTGFCGTLTSFSTWIYNLSLLFIELFEFTNLVHFFQLVGVYLFILFFETFSFLLAFQVGSFTATQLQTIVCSKLCDIQITINDGNGDDGNNNNNMNTKKIDELHFIIMFILNILILVVVLLLIIFFFPNRLITRSELLSSSLFLFLFIIFCIAGTLLRYFLGLQFNNRYSCYPQYGTFLANVIACTILPLTTLFSDAPVIKLENSYPDDGDLFFHYIIICTQYAFCGSLSTISTFISETFNLSLRNASIYLCTSIFINHLLVVIFVSLQLYFM